MTVDGDRSSARKPRADGERNRLRLLESAKAAFAQRGAAASLDEIARTAGVGAGTLYRHFPTRDALVEAVYRNETEQLGAAAEELAASRAPVEALRTWLSLFVDYIATKRVMGAALSALPNGPTALYASSTALVTGAVGRLVDGAVASGDLQRGLDPIDLLRALTGVANIGAGPGSDQNAKRLIDVLIAGLRPGA